MSDYISREAAIDYFRKEAEESRKAFEELGGESGIYADAYNELADDFEHFPAADVEPVRHGRWERTRWIPCSERMPEDEIRSYLCWYEYFRYGSYNAMYQTCGIGYYCNGRWGGEVAQGRDARVLYWMPLPEPPEEEQNGRT